ncbi:hypothetical protein A2U01_0050994, partial [Trifolium medium]|nr:hypothetical protein [Trifolium medium]
MSIISWNCRGLGNPSAVLNLKFLIRRGGGLGVFWRNQVNCTITAYSLNHVDIEIVDQIR